jgi:hypothetical protein
MGYTPCSRKQTNTAPEAKSHNIPPAYSNGLHLAPLRREFRQVMRDALKQI